MKENFPNLVEEIRHRSPGSTESPKEDGLREDHTKTHQNQNVKG